LLLLHTVHHPPRPFNGPRRTLVQQKLHTSLGWLKSSAIRSHGITGIWSGWHRRIWLIIDCRALAVNP
jgi:hypothetical protein